jgi:hypothetical protein
MRRLALGEELLAVGVVVGRIEIDHDHERVIAAGQREPFTRLAGFENRESPPLEHGAEHFAALAGAIDKENVAAWPRNRVQTQHAHLLVRLSNPARVFGQLGFLGGKAAGRASSGELPCPPVAAAQGGRISTRGLVVKTEIVAKSANSHRTESLRGARWSARFT